MTPPASLRTRLAHLLPDAEIALGQPVIERILALKAQRDAVVVQRDSVLSGFQGGAETVELTIDAETWMPLRITFDTDVDTESPLGRRPYHDTGSFTLTTLEPAT